VGGCILLPYNSLLFAQGYFDNYAFPGLAFPFVSMLCYSTPLLLSNIWLAFFGNRFTIESRMWTSNFGTGLTCVALLACSVASWFTKSEEVMFPITMLAIVSLAFFGSLMQSAVLGLAGSMGPKVSAAVMFGLGMSGIMAFALSLILECILGSGSDSGSGSMFQAAALFAFSVAYTATSTWVYHGCFSCRIQEVVEVLATLEEERLSPMLARARSMGGASDTLQADDLLQVQHVSQCSTFCVVMQQIWAQAFNVWFNFAVTMTIFPGVMHEWAPHRDLFLQLLTGCFQVFDVCGRYLANAFAGHLPPSRLWIFAFLRLLFVPAFLLGQWHPESCFIWGSDIGRVLLVALMALSNGFVASCAMMYGPSSCERGLREVAGISMGCMMIIGIFCGTLLAPLTQVAAGLGKA
jgi:equilibrative nucleoside transporter 1/2/3